MENEFFVCQSCGEKNPTANNFCQKCAAPFGEQALTSNKKQPDFDSPIQKQKLTKNNIYIIAAAIILAAVIITTGIYAAVRFSGSDEDNSAQTTEKNNIEFSKSTKAGDIIQFGEYEQDNNTANGKEPIAWRVLTVENGEAFLLADKILDAKQYNIDGKDVTWETCTLRAWLNNGFYNSVFSATEQVRILSTTVVNADNPLHGTDGGNNTSDKLFLLSYSEVTNPAYSFSSGTESNTTREAQGTSFAKSNRLGVYFGNSAWWLRTPGGSYHPSLVSETGHVNIMNSDRVSNYDYSSIVGVRPALWLNLK